MRIINREEWWELPPEEALLMLRQRVHWYRDVDVSWFDNLSGNIFVEPANKTTSLYGFGSEADLVYFKLRTADINQNFIRKINHLDGDDYDFLLENHYHIIERMYRNPVLWLPVRGLPYDYLDHGLATHVEIVEDGENGRLAALSPDRWDYIDSQLSLLGEIEEEFQGFYRYDPYNEYVEFEHEGDCRHAFVSLFEGDAPGEPIPDGIPNGPEHREWGRELDDDEE
jgi:hypothetical protein